LRLITNGSSLDHRLEISLGYCGNDLWQKWVSTERTS